MLAGPRPVEGKPCTESSLGMNLAGGVGNKLGSALGAQHGWGGRGGCRMGVGVSARIPSSLPFTEGGPPRALAPS